MTWRLQPALSRAGGFSGVMRSRIRSKGSLSPTSNVPQSTEAVARDSSVENA